jgi:hypothetical protein
MLLRRCKTFYASPVIVKGRKRTLADKTVGSIDTSLDPLRVINRKYISLIIEIDVKGIPDMYLS